MKHSSTRELISSIIFGIALFDVIGLTGSAECGQIGFNEYVPAAVINLVIMVVALLIGSDKLEESEPEKKKVAPDGNRDSDHKKI